MKLACLDIAFLEIKIFEILVCNLQTKPDVSRLFRLHVSLWIPTSGKKFHGHTFCSFGDHGRVEAPLPDAIKLSGKEDPTNRGLKGR